MILVEIRKSVDTRAGRGLLIASVAVVVLFAIISATTLSTTQIDLAEMIRFAGAPLFILLPTIAMISVTTEWTTRGAMTTFLLNPRRGQVALSKLFAGWALSVVVVLLAAVLCGVVGVIVAWATDTAVGASAPAVLASLLYCIVSVVVLNILAMAIGSIVVSTALGVAIYFLFTAGLDGLADLLVPGWSSYLSFNAGLDAIAAGSLNSVNAAPSIVAVVLWLSLAGFIGLQLFRTREVR